MAATGADALQALSSRVSANVLSAGLALSVFVMAGSFAQALNEPGPDPARRLAIGIALLVVSVGAFALRRPLLGALRDSPELVLGLAALQLGLASLDDLLHGPFFAYCLTSVGIAVTVGGTRIVMLCALLLIAGYAAIVFPAHPPAELARADDLGSAIGALASVASAAIVLTALRWRIGRYVATIARHGAHPPLQPRAAEPLQLAVGRAPWEVLTPAERKVVEALAEHGTSRAIAAHLHLAKATVDGELAAAKRRTGCRTRLQLAALTAHPDWPRSTTDGR